MQPSTTPLLAFARREQNQAQIASFGFSRLIEQQGKILIGECLNIVQHPNGELKQVALRENQLKDILPQFLHYQTDTAPGSSGSPVFNDQWELVALHHSGVPHMDSQGRYLTADGGVWEPAMGEHRIHWMANEGARVSQIVAHLKNQSLSGPARTVRDSIFNAEAAPVALETAAPQQSEPEPAATGMHFTSDGTATWTVPIQISIRLGHQVMTQQEPAPSISTAGPSQPTFAPSSVPTSSDLQAALEAVQTAKTRTYYDEAKDAADRAAYYADIDASLSAKALFQALSTLLEGTHTRRPPYRPAVHVYPFVDLHPDLKLRSIYSQQALDPEELVREDFRIELERIERLQKRLRSEAAPAGEGVAELMDLLEAQLPFNCEHVVPQSWFSKHEPMRGDLHHLFACEPNCNSFRGNIPYFDFPDFEEVIRDECGKRDGTRFEPGAAKGIVARSTLYIPAPVPGAHQEIL